MPHTATNRVDTTAKSFRIIERICELGEAGVSELSEDLDVSKSVVHNHLSTLRELGYVRKSGDAYRPSLRFLELGTAIRSHSAPPRSVVQRLGAAAERFGTAVYVLERDGATGIVTYCRTAAASEVPTVGVGDRLDLPGSPLGLALLAALPDEECDTVLAELDDADAVRERLEADGPFAGTFDASPMIAAGFAHDDAVGAVGIRVPRDADAEIESAVRGALGSLSSALSGSDADARRSFATTKHGWLID